MRPAARLVVEMADEKQSWLRRRVEGAIRGGLTRTYDTIKVDPNRFLMQLRIAHDLPLATFQGVYTLPWNAWTMWRIRSSAAG
jgi:hypothetical protein